MTRYFAILALFSFLGCELGSWLGSGRCSLMRCEAEADAACSVSSNCSISAGVAESDCFFGFADDDGCGRQSDNPMSSCCIPCSPNCCVFLVPDFGLELLGAPLDEVPGQPQGEQHRYPQSFHTSVWHPPACLV